MSVKTETIEVRRCDFCIGTSEARACQHCDKDACNGCGRVYSLVSDYWNGSGHTLISSSFGGPPSLFVAFICHDCAQGDLANSMLSFGFEGSASERKKTGTA